MKIDYGPGYRIYDTCRHQTLVLLLGGGSKSTQNEDVKLAQRLVRQWED